MIKICMKRRGLFESSTSKWPLRTAFGRGYCKKDKEKDEKEIDLEEQAKVRSGILHDKTKSAKEESYFHKEEMEQLKGLKKKMVHDEEEKKNEDKKK